MEPSYDFEPDPDSEEESPPHSERVILLSLECGLAPSHALAC